MAKTKPTDEGVNQIVSELSELKARLKNIEDLAEVKDRRFWPPLKATIEDLKDKHNKTFMGYAEYGQSIEPEMRARKMDTALANRDSLAWVIELVERPRSEADKLRRRIHDLEVELKTKREELAELGPVEV